ncbi:hypothetical protein [Roseibium salinum]|uniref:Uncharacterized protein n=2 Tax=Roseibium salinum TaxID=1604349 RepID=A0ABT3R821_9HYPH|nr:hypothetical protein [Roseibium sp. DSM 29163]MCX2725445.1 hypothetical protein [Roseibium sp. DSM 29163]
MDDLPDFVSFLIYLAAFGLFEYVLSAIAINLQLKDKRIFGTFAGFMGRNFLIISLFYLIFYESVAFISEEYANILNYDIFISVVYQSVIDLIYLVTFGIYFAEYVKDGSSDPLGSIKSGIKHIRDIIVLFFKGLVPLAFFIILMSVVVTVFYAVFQETAIAEFVTQSRLLYLVFAAIEATEIVMLSVIAARLYWANRGGPPIEEIFD